MRDSGTGYLVISCALTTLALPSPVIAQNVTPARLEHPTAGDWLQIGREYNNQRYSPLEQLTPETVSRLVPLALLQLQMAGGTPGAEASPVIADGRLFVTTDFGVVTAFDLRSHTQVWRYAPKVDRAKPCCGPVNRGIALAHGMVFLGTLDSRLIALDADSGTVRWEAVNNDPDSAYSLTMAPVVVGDRVIVGTSGGEFAIRGSVTAYDAHSGQRLWRWYTIPSPSEGGWWGKWTTTAPTGDRLGRDIAQEHADSAKYADSWKRGGGPVWAQPAYDPELRLLYVAVGNPAPSNNGSGRPGDNLYTVSVVALDVETGRLRWYYQAVPHDVWDYDLATPPVLAVVDGRKAVLVPSKMGWVYILDAKTGALIRRSEPFVPQRNLFSIPTPEGVVVAPGPFGGANWPASAYSPQTKLMYVLGTDWPFTLTRAESDPQKGQVWIGGDYTPLDGVEPVGIITALDPATGKIVWRRRGPLLASGSLVTAGGLLFVGDTKGWFRAYAARTGEPLWEFFCGAGVSGPASSFELDGHQMLAVVAAGSRYSALRGSALLIFGAGSARVEMAGGARSETVAVASPAPPAASAARSDWPPAGAVSAGRFLSYSATKKGVWVAMDAGPSMAFNGAVHGTRTVTVPLGWDVEVRFRNRDAMPHSVRVVTESPTIPMRMPTASFGGAESAEADVGSVSGAVETFRFRADRTGTYLLACAVPGHASAGMYVRLVVTPEATAPNYR